MIQTIEYNKIILLSDTHFLDKNPVCRKDNLVENQWDKFEYILNYAKEHNCCIIQAGDMWEKSRSWYLLYKFICLQKKYGISIEVIFGQHDLLFRDMESSGITNVLLQTGKLNLLKELPFAPNDYVHIYGNSYGENIPVVRDRNKKNILVIHKAIGSKASKIGDLEIKDARMFLREHPEFNLILCGDIHEKFSFEVNGRFILNTGCMIRKDVTLIDHVPCFAVLDTNTWELLWQNIPYEKDVITKEHLTVPKERSNLMTTFIQNLNETNVDGIEFKDNFDKYVKENNIDERIIKIIESKMEQEDAKSN